ncbi:hypothetical protein EBR43_02775 [bacterium]|nr:hypothetical protein [bacterium]
MDIKFYLRITGPKEYLPEGTKYEEHTIYREDIEDAREEDEMDQDVIEYLIEEEIASWEQRWCTAIQITKEEYVKLNK